MIRRVFKASNSIASAAIILGLAGLLSRLLGVYRDRLLATTFGAGPTLDGYYAAFRVPDFIFNLLVLGALSAGFIPVFTEYLSRSKSDAWKLAQSVLMVLFFSLVILCLLIYLLAPWIVPLLFSNLGDDVVGLTTQLTRIMLLSPILLGMSAVFGGILQSFKRFLAYSLAPIFYNVGIILGIVILVPILGITGLAWGVVLGSFLHLAMQLGVSMRLGYGLQKGFWKKNGLREILSLMGPRTASLVLTQVNLLIITVLASYLATGSIAIFNFAYNLAFVPIGLFGVSFAIAAFPVLTKFAHDANTEQFKETIVKTVNQISFFLLPTLVVFALLDEQIIRLVYGAGEFDWPSTLLTARTLLYFIPGILAQSLLPLLSRAFFAQKNTKHPLYASIVGVLLTGMLGFYFVKELSLGVVGLSAAFSVASLAQMVLLVWWQQLFYEMDAHMRQLLLSLKQILLGSLLCFVVIQVAKALTGPFVDLLTVRGVLSHFIVPTAAGGVAYLLALRIMKSEEYRYFESAFMKKVRFAQSSVVPVVGKGEEDELA